ncbi:uncharacterized protein LOC113796949 [Dermatophagoides pteronyssinus]|uniref:uncharacterized protein LOC113796949 n=1 Tax=Dermatophagoides pteronyssinus TaxID=6956 RepID=UPI003F664CEC
MMNIDKETVDSMDKTFKNLISILISIVRKNLNENDEHLKQLLWPLSTLLLNPNYCSIIRKYQNNEIELFFLQLRSMFLHDKDNILLLYKFRQNLFPSLIGTNECFNGTKFDNIISWLHRKYNDNLMLENKMITLQKKNIQKMNKIEQIYLDCFGDYRLQTKVEIILKEKTKQLELMKKKSEKCKETERLRRLLAIGNNNDIGSTTAINLHEQYRKITIENQLCQKQINILKQKKILIESMDSTRINRIKQLIKDIKFVKELNNTSPAKQISPINHYYNRLSNNGNVENSPLNFSNQSTSSSISSSTIDNISLSFDAQLKF